MSAACTFCGTVVEHFDPKVDKFPTCQWDLRNCDPTTPRAKEVLLVVGEEFESGVPSDWAFHALDALTPEQEPATESR